MPPVRSFWLGHLYDLRREGFSAFNQRIVAQHGPLVMLRFGPPLLGGRVLLVADPDVARQTLASDLARDYPPFMGPTAVFGRDAVFCTAGDAPLHARRQALIARHLAPSMLRHHARTMGAVWRTTLDDVLLNGDRSIDLTKPVLAGVQEAAIRCWLGVAPNAGDISAALARYDDPGRLLSEPLFRTLSFLGAHRRVRRLKASYAPMLSRSLDALPTSATLDSDAPHRFLAESLDELGWDRTRLTERRYRRRVLRSLALYQHIFTVMLPATGSTGGTILFLLQELAGRPDLQAALRAELGGVDLVADPRVPALTAVTIRESLRLYPQAAAITRRLRQPRTYGGFAVPKGTRTFVQLGTLHRNPASYGEPDRFDPFRFGSTERTSDGKWAGFSLPPMACTGRSFAELQIAIALKEVLTRVDLRPTSEAPIEHNDYRGSVTLRPEPRPIELRLRRTSHTASV